MADPAPPLRRLQREDLEKIAEFRSDPGVAASLVGHTHTMSSDGAERWYEHHTSDPDASAIRAIIDGDDAVIGYAFLRLTDAVTRRAEFAILIGDPNYRGQGVGREVTSWFLDLAFTCMGVLKVELQVLASNQRALGLYQGLGFVTEGKLRGAALRTGEYIDVVFMGIFAHEWMRHRSV